MAKRTPRSPRYKFEIDRASWKAAQRKLEKIPLEMKEKALKKGMREASKMVGLAARPEITQPGYEGDKPNLPALSKNIKWVIRGRKRDNFVAGHIGADYRKVPHFHLYEEGHKMVTKSGRTTGYVMGQRDFKRSTDENKGKAGRKLIDAIKAYTLTLAEKGAKK